MWCGWACPQTALLDLTAWLSRARRCGRAALALTYAGVAVVSAVVAANLVWYFVPPRAFLSSLVSLTLGPVATGSWLVTAGVIFADLVLVRHAFCASTCPYAKLQGVLLDRHSLVVAYDPRRQDCVDCRACVRVCPVGIDIRDGLQAACVACGECIDACTPIMRKLKRPANLVGYFFGEPGTARRTLRPAVRLALNGVQDVVLRPDEVRLEPGEHRRIRVAAAGDVAGGVRGTLPAQLVTSSRAGPALRATRAVPFAVPAR